MNPALARNLRALGNLSEIACIEESTSEEGITSSFIQMEKGEERGSLKQRYCSRDPGEILTGTSLCTSNQASGFYARFVSPVPLVWKDHSEYTGFQVAVQFLIYKARNKPMPPSPAQPQGRRTNFRGIGSLPLSDPPRAISSFAVESVPLPGSNVLKAPTSR